MTLKSVKSRHCHEREVSVVEATPESGIIIANCQRYVRTVAAFNGESVSSAIKAYLFHATSVVSIASGEFI